MSLKPYYIRKNESVCQCESLGFDEHEIMYECKKCHKCCADEPTIAESNDAYEDQGTCMQCSLDSGMKINELAGIFDRD